LIPIVQAMMYYEALRYAEQAAHYAPDDPAVRVNQARLLYLLGRTSDAEQALQALQSAGKAAQTLDLVRRQLQVVGSDPALQQIERFLNQRADESAAP
jgi:predicted Zn-dependent protease